MNTWANYLSRTKQRLDWFFSNPTVVIYFITIVVIAGSFGVWYSGFEFCTLSSYWNNKATITNLSTYSISILAATMADFLLGNRDRGRGFKIFAFSIFIIAFLASIISMVRVLSVYGLLGLALTYFLWIIVFADDNTKGAPEMVDPATPMGGSSPETVRMQGSLKEFNS